MKGYNKKLSDVYLIPLPFQVKSLPALVPHNPVSIAMYIWALFFTRSPAQPLHLGELTDLPTAAFGVRVRDPSSAMQLWQQGFFGKGSLSRSEPSWFGRTARRLGLDGGELTLEEVTEMRRAKRRQFKLDRETQQQQALWEKKRKEGSVQGEFSPDITNTVSTEPPPSVRDEDRQLVRGDTIERLEFLQLTPCEAVFLQLGLGVLQIEHDGTLGQLLAKLLKNENAWREYVVYHYFRSLGWCVRDGVKFGADFLLYRKGPPFLHAEFAVMVMDPQEQRPWWWLHSNMRVLGSAKKTLTLVYVDGPQKMPDWQQIRSVDAFRRCLAEYTVQPVTFSRFAPSKNRD